MYRFLPFIFIAIFLVAVVTILPLKRQLLYALNLSGDPTTSCCSVSEILENDGSFDEGAKTAFFNGKEVDYPKTSLAQAINPMMNTGVLGTTNSEGAEKWIEVSIDQQKLRAWEGDKIVMEYPISSGLWAPTPKGTFHIWYKTRFQSMIGGSKELGTYYNLPNVPYNMFFHQGFAVHGAYWHNNFGHPMSHGCVNEPIANAAQIFDWAGPTLPGDKNAILATAQNPGTKVYVH